jgi:hypothetical protein
MRSDLERLENQFQTYTETLDSQRESGTGTNRERDCQGISEANSQVQAEASIEAGGSATILGIWRKLAVGLPRIKSFAVSLDIHDTATQIRTSEALH